MLFLKAKSPSVLLDVTPPLPFAEAKGGSVEVFAVLTAEMSVADYDA